MQGAIDLINEGLHAVGRTITSVDSRIKPWAVFNRAGNAVFTRHRWSWRSQEVTLAAVADQSYITLPQDFSAMVAVTSTSGTVQVVSRARILELQQSAVTTSGNGGWFLCFDGWDRQANPELLPLPRLDVYPTPTADGTPTLTLEYQRTWRRMVATDPSGIPNLPDRLEWALVLKCRSMFKALHFEDPGAEEALYESEIQRLIVEDVPQMNYGRMRGGADECPTDSNQTPRVTDVTWS